jgi:ATP-binding cassette subfamily B protein
MASTLSSHEIDFRYNTKLYLQFLRPYTLVFAFISVLVFLQELRIIAEKYFFKIIVDNGVDLHANIISQEFFVRIGLILLSVYVAMSIVNIGIIWLRVHLLNRLEGNMIQDVKLKFFRHILQLDHNFHTTHKTGSLISRLTRGGRAIEQLTDTITFNFLTLFLQVIVTLGVIVYFDIFSVVIIGATVVLFVVYSFYIQKLQESSSILANKSEDIEKGNIADFFTNVDAIKYYGKEKIINQRYAELSQTTKIDFIRNWDFYRIMISGQVFILSCGTVMLLWATIPKFIQGTLTLGTLTLIYTSYIGLMGYMFDFVNGLRVLYRTMADFQDLFQYNKVSNQIQDKPGAPQLNVTRGAIQFKKVYFKYGKRTIFENFNLSIKENEKVALVGHSGSGKTTLIKLLKRFYDIDSGSISIDNTDIRNVTQESVRAEVSIVPQECVLFDDTIYNNILFANPSASRKDVLKAIKFAQLDRIIKQFPLQENTIVGERGVRLSGGEKQRVSIARAILANKKILLLDEATSSLDSETEHEIQKDLHELLKGRTSIIIAHRLSTIMNADRIIVMKDGKIVQEGTHEELIKKSGEYKKLWNLQKGGYIK